MPLTQRLLSSRLFIRRARGVRLLGFLPEGERATAAVAALGKEKAPLIALRLVMTLLETSTVEGMDAIASFHERADRRTADRILAMVETRGRSLEEWALKLTVRGTEDSDPAVRRYAYRIGSELYPERIDLAAAMDSGDPEIRSAAVNVLLPESQSPDYATAARLLSRDTTRAQAIARLRDLLRSQGRYVEPFRSWYRSAVNAEERSAWAEILGERLEYFLHRLDEETADELAPLIADSIRAGYTADLIAFLNANKNPRREEILKRVLSPLIGEDDSFAADCRRYLDEGIRERLNVDVPREEAKTERISVTARERLYLAALMAATVFALPAAYLVGIRRLIPYLRGIDLFTGFYPYAQGVFIVYTASISALYLFLMLVSAVNLSRQRAEWSLADSRFLFSPGVMPGVSVIVPAYNEAKTIVQSLRSLLSMAYPKFEIIVVNDGSSDSTLEEVIGHFNLERSDSHSRPPIATAPVLGVYRSRTESSVLLVDKMNGGKADSLNAGIGFARFEYVCSLDVDSLLERDSLTKLLFRTITSKTETVASGGNVIPVNGCETRSGHLERIRISDNPYARYQTVEYLRSFIAGRLGWARLRSLVILSGAFGAFSRQRLIDIGGYLTGRSELRRDTVGEDFEIVVRLIRRLRESKTPFLVDYAYNANCWTEVPEDIGQLSRQRDRWHRGLIECLTFHRKMLFNPRYGAAGLVALPYYLVYELLGSFIEALGYLLMAAAFLLGLLSPASALLLFSVIVLLGLLVSSAALFLSERGILYFQGRDFAAIIRHCVLENFGYRQYVGFLRPLSYLSFLFRRDKGWQKLERKGFRSVQGREGGL